LPKPEDHPLPPLEPLLPLEEPDNHLLELSLPSFEEISNFFYLPIPTVEFILFYMRSLWYCFAPTPCIKWQEKIEHPVVRAVTAINVSLLGSHKAKI
jgi:hypothetical protein